MPNVLQFSKPEDEWIEIPSGYKTAKKWTPQIGDIFPNFRTWGTEGEFCLHNWAEGEWVYFFSHRKAFAPICTTELASLAVMQEDFKRANIALAAISVGTLYETMTWVEEVEALFDIRIDFPVLSDPNGMLSEEMGLIHPKSDPNFSIRKSFIIGPDLRLRMMFDYPACVGRSSEEALRATQALQAAEATNLAVPADWQPGDEFLARPSDDADQDLYRRYGRNWTKVSNSLKVIQPSAVKEPA
ncbi:redoxin domain-containing protein [Roseovarius sp. MMSF_3281]|uniref:redoxin domain-containing protein n=1 Tax=Roseovarius sp. MMSF_3281 TaxID=3046694 RepID=UPI00273DF6C3|nr:redoxin domain-containing protein [Roseovarius sp. MMSF_3281]